MASHRASEVKAQMARWISVWVIQEGLCPFAREPWDQERVRLRVSPAHAVPELLADFDQELQILNQASAADIETSILICPGAPADFLEFLDLSDLASELLAAAGQETRYQVVSFHPAYCFEGLEPEDRANATNRSPYPALQLLRQKSVNAVLKNHADPAAIYKRNIAHLRTMSPDRWAKLRRNNEEQAMAGPRDAHSDS